MYNIAYIYCFDVVVIKQLLIALTTISSVSSIIVATQWRENQFKS